MTSTRAELRAHTNAKFATVTRPMLSFIAEALEQDSHPLEPVLRKVYACIFGSPGLNVQWLKCYI